MLTIILILIALLLVIQIIQGKQIQKYLYDLNAQINSLNNTINKKE